MEVPSINSKNKWILGVTTAVCIYFILKYSSKTLNDNLVEDNSNEDGYDTSAVWDNASEQIIKKLHPKIRNRARAFINEAEKQGMKVKLTSGKRTYAEQDKLYAKGRTTAGGIVTNAKAGYSWHNFSLAFDTVLIENGKANYNTKNWKKLGALGKTFGFEWGGDWKSFLDLPHFQDTFGMTTAQARLKKSDNNIDNQGYLLA